MTNEDSRRAALAQIDAMRDDILATLSAAVQIPSITPKYPGLDYDELVGGEGRCNASLRPTYEAAGATVDMWAEEPGRDNIVGVVKGAGGGRSLIFNGHIDTVPPGDPATWKWGDPWSGRIEDGKLYGLGAVDMKGGIVAFAKAAEALNRAGIRLKGDLILESVVGEETMDHERGVSATVRRGYVADAAIVTEPTGLPFPAAVSPCSAGGGRLIINVKGKATHATARGSLIWPGGEGERFGVSAIDKGFIVYEALRRLEAEWGFTKRHPLFPPGHATIGVNVMVGRPPGPLVPFIIPHECLLDIQVMYLPNDDWDSVKAEVEAYLNRVFDNDHWLRENRPTMEWPHHWPPYNTPEDHPICQAIIGAHEAVTGASPIVKGFSAVDDATYLERGGIPSISFGPGNIMMAHATDEYIECDHVIEACKIYAATAIDWCGVA
ncbi:MAG: ArgE/DapE family deacylase [Thermomicrobiales bacterium]|nr:ArgE/DapE family deacylase [Thermomicrobiales bacterium]